MASSKALPGLPEAFGRDRQELESLDKFDKYIRAAQSTDKETLTKNINNAARTATRDLLSSGAFRHVIDCIKHIVKDLRSHKETAIFLVDSILVHADHYCEEASQIRFQNHFRPLIVNLFKKAMGSKHGKYRAVLANKLMKKIVPKWREHCWFSEEALEKVQDMCLRKAPPSVIQRFKESEVKAQLPYEDAEDEESKVNVKHALNSLQRFNEKRKAGAIQPVTPGRPGGGITPGYITPGTPGMAGMMTPMVGSGTPMFRTLPRAVLSSVPRTPMINSAVPMTPRANSILTAIPQTPKAGGALGVPMTPKAGVGVPMTPMAGAGPGTPNRNMVPGTPNMSSALPVPGTPNMQGMAPTTPGGALPRGQPVPMTPAAAFNARPRQGQPFTPAGPGATAPSTPAAAFGASGPGVPVPSTPFGAVSRGQPFTPAGGARQPFTPAQGARQPSTPAGASARGTPFTPGAPVGQPSTPTSAPMTPFNAAPRGQPFTPAASTAQPFTPVGAKAAPVHVPRTPADAVAGGQPFTPAGGQPFTPAAPARGQPFTPAAPAGGQPFTPAAPAGGQPFTPAAPAGGQPFTPAAPTGGQPFTPAPSGAVPSTPMGLGKSKVEPFTPPNSAMPFTPAGAAMPVTPAAATMPRTPAGAAMPFTPAGAAMPFTPAGVAPQPYTPARGGLPMTPGDGLGEQTPAVPPDQDGGDTPVPHTRSREEVPTEEHLLDLPTPKLPDGMETPMHELHGAETPNMRVAESPPAKKAKF